MEVAPVAVARQRLPLVAQSPSRNLPDTDRYLSDHLSNSYRIAVTPWYSRCYVLRRRSRRPSSRTPNTSGQGQLPSVITTQQSYDMSSRDTSHRLGQTSSSKPSALPCGRASHNPRNVPLSYPLGPFSSPKTRAPATREPRLRATLGNLGECAYLLPARHQSVLHDITIVRIATSRLIPHLHLEVAD